MPSFLAPNQQSHAGVKDSVDQGMLPSASGTVEAPAGGATTMDLADTGAEPIIGRPDRRDAAGDGVGDLPRGKPGAARPAAMLQRLEDQPGDGGGHGDLHARAGLHVLHAGVQRRESGLLADLQFDGLRGNTALQVPESLPGLGNYTIHHG